MKKEKDEAFDYGGFSFARETLNLVDNLERAKQSLKNDENLKNTKKFRQNLRTFRNFKKRYIIYF